MYEVMMGALVWLVISIAVIREMRLRKRIHWQNEHAKAAEQNFRSLADRYYRLVREKYKVMATYNWDTKTWTLHGKLPAGLVFDYKTGAVSGVPHVDISTAGESRTYMYNVDDMEKEANRIMGIWCKQGLPTVDAPLRVDSTTRSGVMEFKVATNLQMAGGGFVNADVSVTVGGKQVARDTVTLNLADAQCVKRLKESGWTPPSEKREYIQLSTQEIKSGVSRVMWAENLIEQLPRDHEGRNSWLINYGVKAAAQQLRHERMVSEASFGCVSELGRLGELFEMGRFRPLSVQGPVSFHSGGYTPGAGGGGGAGVGAGRIYPDPKFARGDVVQHKKSQELYVVLDRATMEDTMADVYVYRGLYGNKRIWVRTKVYMEDGRFVKVGNVDPVAV